ncbi:MAG: DUF4435 domain-containing protein [Rikenellaceae bacterium]|nr:DUF4435 domain-containing protein [Rikenellaceae bacterium]
MTKVVFNRGRANRSKREVQTVNYNRLPIDPSKRLVRVYVEGYEDVAFWRGIFDHFDNPYYVFEISVPNRPDMAKGKKVLEALIPQSNEQLLLCVDGDFDYLFQKHRAESRKIVEAPFMFHTYAYATENYVCYAPSLHNVCVRATKNDTRIFDFEKFMAEYSRTIYPLFLWYALSARDSDINVFQLSDFRNSVKINYLEPDDNARTTLDWLSRQVSRRRTSLENARPDIAERIDDFARELQDMGVYPEDTYLYMHGHTLMDNVVMITLNAVCERLRCMSVSRINSSSQRGQALSNELSNYSNQLRNVRDVLLDNENYTDCFLYHKLSNDIDAYLCRAVEKLKK